MMSIHYNPHGYRTICGARSPSTNVKENVTCEVCMVTIRKSQLMDEQPGRPYRMMNPEYKLYHIVDGKVASEYIEHLEAENASRGATIQILRDGEEKQKDRIRLLNQKIAHLEDRS